MSRKFVKGEYPKEEEDDEEDPDSDGKKSGGSFDPDIFLYGAVQRFAPARMRSLLSVLPSESPMALRAKRQGGMKISASQSPTLMAAIGHELCELWEGIKKFFVGDYRNIDVRDMAGSVVPGAQRGIFVTHDLTYYLNDTNFNENSQVLYQYDEKNREKASYVYGDFDERISADLTRRAVRYVDDKPGDYTYLYDGQGSVTQSLREGKEARSFDYDPFGRVEEGTEENDVIFGYNGEEYTEATQLQYLRQRHYDPDMGAFTSKDTYRGDLFTPISQNQYTYGANDPVNNCDPGGDKPRKKGGKTKVRNKGKSNKPTKTNKSGKTGGNIAQIVATQVVPIGQTIAQIAVNPGMSKAQRDALLRANMAIASVNYALKNLPGLKDKAKGLQNGNLCNQMMLTGQYYAYMSNRSPYTLEKFLEQKQMPATIAIGLAPLVAIGAVLAGEASAGAAGTAIAAYAGPMLTISSQTLQKKVLELLLKTAGKALSTTVMQQIEEWVRGDDNKPEYKVFPNNPENFNPKGLVKKLTIQTMDGL